MSMNEGIDGMVLHANWPSKSSNLPSLSHFSLRFFKSDRLLDYNSKTTGSKVIFIYRHIADLRRNPHESIPLPHRPCAAAGCEYLHIRRIESGTKPPYSGYDYPFT